MGVGRTHEKTKTNDNETKPRGILMVGGLLGSGEYISSQSREELVGTYMVGWE